MNKQNILLNRDKKHLVIVANKNRVDLQKQLLYIWLRKNRINAILKSGDKISLPGGGEVIFRAKGDALHGVWFDFQYEAK